MFDMNLQWLISKRYLIVILLVIGLVGVFFLFKAEDKIYLDIQDAAVNHLELAYLLSFIVNLIFSTVLIPTIPLTIVISAIISPLSAFIIASITNTIAAIIHYRIGSNVADVMHFEEQKKRLPKKIRELPIHSPLFLLIGRVIPGGGPKGLSFVCGAYHVPFGTYLWTTFLTNCLGAWAVAYGSSAIINFLLSPFGMFGM